MKSVCSKTQTSECAQARAAYLSSVSCVGEKTKDVFKCRKTCDWFYVKGKETPLGTYIIAKFEKWIDICDYMIYVFSAGRAVAIMLNIYRCCKMLVESDTTNRKTSILFYADIWG